MNSPIYQQAVSELQRQAEEAQRRGDPQARTASLATATPESRPSVRIVNIVRITADGLCFFAEAASGKARQVLANPRAALCFNWSSTHTQALVEGSVVTLSDDDADDLWRHQPRDYGLGHWASAQAGPALAAPEMKERLKAARMEFSDQRIPRPPGWLGFSVQPDRIDLWAASWQRLELHRLYVRSPDGEWRVTQRNP